MPAHLRPSQKQSLLQELDDNVLYLVALIEAAAASLPLELQIRVERWCMKLTMFKPTQLELKRNRQSYLLYLLRCVETKCFEEPFQVSPDVHAPYTRLPSYIAMEYTTMPVRKPIWRTIEKQAVQLRTKLASKQENINLNDANADDLLYNSENANILATAKNPSLSTIMPKKPLESVKPIRENVQSGVQNNVAEKKDAQCQTSTSFSSSRDHKPSVGMRSIGIQTNEVVYSTQNGNYLLGMNGQKENIQALDLSCDYSVLSDDVPKYNVEDMSIVELRAAVVRLTLLAHRLVRKKYKVPKEPAESVNQSSNNQNSLPAECITNGQTGSMHKCASHDIWKRQDTSSQTDPVSDALSNRQSNMLDANAEFLNMSQGGKLGSKSVPPSSSSNGKQDDFFILIPNGVALDAHHPLYNLLYS